MGIGRLCIRIERFTIVQYLQNYQQQNLQSLLDSVQINVKWSVPITWVNMLRNIDPNMLRQLHQQENTDMADDVFIALKTFQNQFPMLLANKYIVQNGESYESEWNINKNQFLHHLMACIDVL